MALSAMERQLGVFGFLPTTHAETNTNKMVREPNVLPHKQIIKDDDVKECISIE